MQGDDGARCADAVVLTRGLGIQVGGILAEVVEGAEQLCLEQADGADGEDAPVGVVADQQVGAGLPAELGPCGPGDREPAVRVERQGATTRDAVGSAGEPGR